MTPAEFATRYQLNGLNEQQRMAVQKVNGATLLLATPGSGKTTVLVARIGYLVHVCGIEPRNILALTYTKAAAAEMKERFIAKYGENLSSYPVFSTINAFCVSVLGKARREKGLVVPELLPQNDSIIREIAVKMCSEYPRDAQIKTLQQLVGKAKNEMMGPLELAAVDAGQEISFPSFFAQYQRLMADRGLMDFDDQLLMAYQALQNYPDLLARAQQTYLYVSLDEAQDTSLIQHKIVQMLVGRKGNLFMVGDEDQSIYGFRGAYPDALLHFRQDYDDPTQLYMETNYRSGAEIVEAANAFIKRNKMRNQKDMKPNDAKHGEIHVVQSRTMKDQQELIQERIGDFLNRPGETLAILGRNNESILPTVHKMTKLGIPVNAKDATGAFFGTFVVADMLNFLAFATDPCNRTLFNNLYYKMGLYMTKDTAKLVSAASQQAPDKPILQILVDYVDEKEVRTLTRLQLAMERAVKQPPMQAIHTIMEDAGYGDGYLRRKVDAQNSEQSLKLKVNTLRLMAEEYPTIQEFLAGMTDLRNMSDLSAPGTNITLSTIHGSKGMEFDHVIMVDAIERVFPKSYADMPQNEMEEEARLFYVGMTRARSVLEFAVYERFYDQTYKPSTFLSSFITRQQAQAHASGEQTGHHGNYGYSWKQKSVNSQANIAAGETWVGKRVAHKTFGRGEVLSVSGTGIADIDFVTAGRKRLMISTCLENGLLNIVD